MSEAMEKWFDQYGLTSICEGVIYFDNPCYETAIIGITPDNRLCYSYKLMVQYLMEHDNCTEEQASEWIDYNTIGAHFDLERDPVIVYDFDLED